MMPRKIEIELTKQEKMNRYIEHQLIRAEKTTNPELFWTIAKQCIFRSVSFRTSAYNRVFPNWWIEESMQQTASKLNKINKLVKNWNDDLIYRRVYIPKKDDKFRPLGVPSGEWRVIMHMWSNWLTLYFRDYVKEFNHAYQPGKGTKTAWEEIIKKVLKQKYIYEFDLKEFFPNVEINKVTEILEKAKVPKRIVYHLENINRCVPELPEKHLTNESILKDRYKVHTTLKKGEIDPTLSIWQGLQDFIDANGEEILLQCMKEDGYDDMYEYAQAQWAMFDHYKPSGMGTAFIGLPQGLNTSPILSILTLKEWSDELKKQGINLIMYADDGLMYSDQPFDPPMEKLNKDKSKWVRRNGNWLRDLDFLGLKYIPEIDLLCGNTRKGSQLSFKTDQLKLFDLFNALRGEFSTITPESKLEDLVDYNLLGLIQARLYNGTWENEEFPEREKNVHKNSWWSTRSVKHDRRLITTTATGYLSSLVKATIT